MGFFVCLPVGVLEEEEGRKEGREVHYPLDIGHLSSNFHKHSVNF